MNEFREPIIMQFPENEEQFREYIDQIDLNDISHTRIFSMDFMRQFRDYIDIEAALKHLADDDNIPIKFWKEMGLEVIGNLVFYTDYFGQRYCYGIWNKEGIEIAERGSLNENFMYK